MTGKRTPEYEQGLRKTREFWNGEASSFDDQPDHGLSDPVILAAWTDMLRRSLPSAILAVLDIGCGTGSLSILLTGFGHQVTGIDVSPAMIALAEAKAKASRRAITFQVMDAAYPELPSHQFDALVCRHLLWALPDYKNVLRRRVRLLKPRGRLLLIEGCWYTGAGLHPGEVIDALPRSLTGVEVTNLSDQPELWGAKVDDERYMITALLNK